MQPFDDASPFLPYLPTEFAQADPEPIDSDDAIGARDSQSKQGRKMERKQRFAYFKFFADDWLNATRHMSLEERGAYIDLICLIMNEQGGLPDDERRISHMLHISTRKWRAVKKQLEAQEKIRTENGLIVNERCLRELDSLLTHRRTSSESASNRERTKRENRETPNEINDDTTTTLAPRARVIESDSRVREEVTPIVPLAGDGLPKAKRPAKAKAGVPENYSESFTHFWKLYPRREGKAIAAKSWDRLTLDQQRRAYLALKDQLKVLEMRAKDPRGNFCPLPATWINQGRFDDELAQGVPTNLATFVNGHYTQEAML
jgi:uncharacterized protein YdaU (DUF1376 family)